VTTTIRTSIVELQKLVSPVLGMAAEPWETPQLTCLRIRSGDGHLTADATNRYLAGVSRRPAPGTPDGFDQLIRAADIKTLLRTIKPYPDNEVPLTVEVIGNILRVSAGQSRDLVATVLEFDALSNTAGPNIWDVLSRGLDNEVTGEPVAVNPRLLTQFQDATHRSVNPDGRPLILRAAAGASKPVIAVCGDHFIGAVMPVRTDPIETAAVLDAWRTRLTPTKEKTHA
jgi:hypothetical protein